MIVRYKAAAAYLLLAALTLLFFWKILLTNLILVGVDTFLYFYPYKTYATEALLSGRLPLWNPHIFMGVPFLANSQAGLLYPPNWLFLWASPPKQVAYSIGLHIWIAGVGATIFARQRLGLSHLTAFAGGILFAFSGFLGAQVEHLNQLQVSAWLPWLFLLFDKASPVDTTSPAVGGQSRRHRSLREALVAQWNSKKLWQDFWRSRRYIVLLGLMIALMLLAGHTQSVYISLLGLGLYGLLRQGMIWGSVADMIAAAIWRIWRMLPLVIAGILAIMISAAQLLPTLELASQSTRSGGLTYNETVAFSLNPLKILFTFLPPYGVSLEAKLGLAFSEFVAYIGLIPLLLAALGVLIIWRNWRQANQPQAGWGLSLTGLAGLGLAFGLFTGPIYFYLYLFVPGFNLFRVPARWLLLYTFAIAMMAAIGLEHLRWKRWRTLLVGLIMVELFLAAQSLRYNQPTAPEAYSSLRTAIVQLQAAQQPTDRFLSLSGIEYDPGDLREIEQIFSDQLPERAVYDYVIAEKQKEVLFFNLPMVYGLQAIDGYDGGLLPLESFIEWQRLFLPEDDLSLDGRLREKLSTVPPGRLLSWAGVQHIITDKVKDVWLNDIFYDLQFPAKLHPATIPEVWTTDIPNLQASAVGVVFNTPSEIGSVGQLVIEYDSGTEERFTLEAGAGQPWPNEEFGLDYNVIFENLREEPISKIGLVAEEALVVRGISLIQQASTTSRSVILSTEGNYHFIHGGDVKIYENLDVLPRAFVVHQTDVVADLDEAVSRLQDPAFDLTSRIVRVADDPAEVGALTLGNPAEPDSLEIISYQPERIELRGNLSSPGWLVLMDTDYPGWEATVNGNAADISTVNIMFRVIELPAGPVSVVFAYHPQSFYMGRVFSGLGIMFCLIILIIPSQVWRRRRKSG